EKVYSTSFSHPVSFSRMSGFWMSEADRFMVGLRQPFSNENRFLFHRVPLCFLETIFLAGYP
ncbi:MAG: hypothetical protein VXZ15_11090, partial [Planctomycetota bacterium]|nr:hypothetical protein [Planctomycetota bacterium]